MKKIIRNAAVIMTAAIIACLAACSMNPGSGTVKPKIIETVSIPGKTYQAAKTETTYEQWKTVYDWAVQHGYTFANLGAEGSMGTDGAAPTENKKHPVTKISWRDAVIWCNALSEMEGLTPYYYENGTTDFTDTTKVVRVAAPGNPYYESSKGTNPAKVEWVNLDEDKTEKAVFNLNSNGYRLPTSDEWKYVYRGGETCNFSGSNDYTEVGWLRDNSDDKTHPVASLAPNKYGVYDMTGNVTEHCWDKSSGAGQRDAYGDNYTVQQNSTLNYGSCPQSYCMYTENGFRVFKNGYIGDKLPSESKAVGDIVFNDGSAVPYTSGLTLTDAQKLNAVAVIYYKGTNCSNDGRERTLGFGLKPYTGSDKGLCTSSAKMCDKQFSSIAVTVSGGMKNLSFSGDKEGKDNLTAIAAGLGAEDDTSTYSNYPAFEYALKYSTNAQNLGVYSNDWYIPSASELWELYPYIESVKAILGKLGSTILDDGRYFWTSSQRTDYKQMITINLTSEYSAGGADYRSADNSGPVVLTIREF